MSSGVVLIIAAVGAFVLGWLCGNSAGREHGHFDGYGEGRAVGWRDGCNEAAARITALTAELEQNRKRNEPVKRLAELN